MQFEHLPHPAPVPAADRDAMIADPGFGKVFTDHMLTIEWTARDGWQDAKIVPYGPLALDPAASALHYGQMMFEGMKAFRGADGKVQLWRLMRHCQRMHDGAPRLCLPALPPEDMAEAVRALVKVDEDWVPSAPDSALYIRPTLVATEAFLGVRPAERVLFFIILSPVGAYYGAGALTPVKIFVERELTRAAPGGLGAVKAAANYAASLQAAVRAKKDGYAQVLWLDVVRHETLEEVGTMNLFVCLGDELVTPPLSDSILSGVTRDCVLTVAREWGLKVSERPLSISEVIASGMRSEVRTWANNSALTMMNISISVVRAASIITLRVSVLKNADPKLRPIIARLRHQIGQLARRLPRMAPGLVLLPRQIV